MELLVDTSRYFYLPIEQKHDANVFEKDNDDLFKKITEKYEMKASFKVVKYTDNISNSKSHYAIRFKEEGIVDVSVVVTNHKKINYDFDSIENLILELKLAIFDDIKVSHGNTILKKINFTNYTKTEQ